MNKEIKIEPAEDPKIEEVKAEEIPKEEKKKIDEKVVFSDKKQLKFYETLRKRILKFANEKGGKTGSKFAEYLLSLPDFLILLCRLAVDKRVPSSQKFMVGGIIAYIISPIDIIPDFIPVIGYVDDLVLAVFGLNIVLNDIDKKIVLENWSGQQDLLELMQRITLTAEQFLDRNILKKIKHWIQKITK